MESGPQKRLTKSENEDDALNSSLTAEEVAMNRSNERRMYVMNEARQRHERIMEKDYMRRQVIERERVSEVCDSSVSESCESAKAYHNSRGFGDDDINQSVNQEVFSSASSSYSEDELD